MSGGLVQVSGGWAQSGDKWGRSVLKGVFFCERSEKNPRKIRGKSEKGITCMAGRAKVCHRESIEQHTEGYPMDKTRLELAEERKLKDQVVVLRQDLKYLESRVRDLETCMKDAGVRLVTLEVDMENSSNLGRYKTGHGDRLVEKKG